MLGDRHYMRDQQRRGWNNTNQRQDESILKPLIITISAISLLAMMFPGISEQLLLHPFYIRQFQLWRLVSHMFVHGGIGHLFFNMYALYLFGQLLEHRIGSKNFLNLYFISGILGAILYLIPCNFSEFHYLLPSGNYNVNPVNFAYAAKQISNGATILGGCVGASGGVFGVIIGAAMLFPKQRISLLIPPVDLTLKTFALIYVGLELFLQVGQFGGNIAHLAHLGGALGGFLYLKHISKSNYSNKSYGQLISDLWKTFQVKFKQSKFKVVPKDRKKDIDSRDIDRILDKIGEKGIESLTAKERETLHEKRKNIGD